MRCNSRSKTEPPELASGIWSLVVIEANNQYVFLLANTVVLVVFNVAGWGSAWLLMWLLLVSRLRNIAEHACTVENGIDPLRHACITHASLLAHVLIAPYCVNHHGEHHLFTQIPCRNPPKAHRLPAASGVTARIEVQPGCTRVLQLATASEALTAGRTS